MGHDSIIHSPRLPPMPNCSNIMFVQEGGIFDRLKTKAKVVVDVSTSSKVSIKEVEEPNDDFRGDIAALKVC